jgi:hypothetical protein
VTSEVDKGPDFTVDTLCADSGFNCDVLTKLGIDNDSLPDILNAMKGDIPEKQKENLIVAMNAVKDMVHAPVAGETPLKFSMSDLDQDMQTLLKSFGMKDENQLTDLMAVVNGDTKEAKIAKLVAIKNTVLPYVKITTPTNNPVINPVDQ